MAIAQNAPVLADAAYQAQPRWRTLRVLLRKKLATIGLAYLILFYVCGIAAPLIAPYDPNDQNLRAGETRQGPTWDHPLGTDTLGRDLLSRVIYSTRTTVLFTVVVVITGGFFLGLGLGLLAGYRGGWVDTAVMRIGEVLGGLPTLILILAITAAFRTRITDASYWFEDHTFLTFSEAKTFLKFVIISGATVPFAWVGSARIVRSQALAIRELSYVTAAEAMGASTRRVVFRHILPGVMPLFIVGLSGSMAGMAGAEVSLSYLGLGIDPPAASFGSLISEAGFIRTFQQYPHLLIGAATPVVLFFYAWNLLGDALVDVLDPRLNLR